VIGLLGGRAMRALRASDEAQARGETDPITLALALRDQGARWLHLVDLDGARVGAPQQLDLIQAIIAAAELPTQVAGGMAAPENVADALEAGAARVVLNGATPDDQALVAICAALWGERIAVALDARDGQVTVAGWLPSDVATALDVARAMRYLRVSTMLVTSVSSQTPDPLMPELRRAAPGIQLIAGGAIASLDQLRDLFTVGVDGALLGRALNDELFTIGEALAVARDTPAAVIEAPEPDEEEEAPQGGYAYLGDTSGSGWVDTSILRVVTEGDASEDPDATLEMGAIVPTKDHGQESEASAETVSPTVELASEDGSEDT
jgi:phosphoribosylformimino-5-aminoimidazole carboxamide ribotide isomerase